MILSLVLVDSGQEDEAVKLKVISHKVSPIEAWLALPRTHIADEKYDTPPVLAQRLL